MEISKELQDAMNDQLNFELYSAYIYQSMAAYFESINLSGMAHWMLKQAIEEYEHAMLFRSWSSTSTTLAVELAKRIFLEGYYAVLAFTSGCCSLCEKCNLEGGYCVKPFDARPSMESCGISVFDTARNAGYEIKVLKQKETQHLRYGLILVC